MPSALLYLAIMLVVIVAWFLLLKRPVYEAVLISFIILLTITGTWGSVLGYIDTGLKTSLLQRLKTHPDDLPAHRADLAASYQEAVMESLAKRADRALKATGARTLACVGGVAKNRVLRAKLEAICQHRKAALRLAPMAYCTDNAAMIAAAAGLRARAGLPNPPALEADPSLPLVEAPPD